jgi:hypothetical protein
MHTGLRLLTDCASSGDGQLIHHRPAGNELSRRRAASGAEQDCVTAAARARLGRIVAGRRIHLPDSCGRFGGRRHVGGECRPGAQHRDCNAGDHSNCLTATVAKASEVPDVAAHQMFSPRVLVVLGYRPLTQSHGARFRSETQITTAT